MSHKFIRIKISDPDGVCLDEFVVCSVTSEDAHSFSDEENVGVFKTDTALVQRIKEVLEGKR